MAEVLARAIYKSSATDPSQLAMLIGIGDSGTFGSSNPTWRLPANAQDRCYVGACLKLPDATHLLRPATRFVCSIHVEL
jgi:hypothetical protein